MQHIPSFFRKSSKSIMGFLYYHMLDAFIFFYLIIRHFFFNCNSCFSRQNAIWNIQTDCNKLNQSFKMIRIPYMCLNLQTIRFLNKLLKQHILFSTYFFVSPWKMLSPLKFENASERRLCLKTRARKWKYLMILRMQT